ncbi:hypothetical protein MTVDSCj16_1093 [Campylobacter jejuni subsp. jejuni]|uniref:Uncharacterized protein n=1 Tax=Campylobacter jejuni TaxID=197 RepID=A0A1D8JKZ1_CAMJU|nr:hypothetical protein MTVDSCj16_1093 [Campylobacter jejuni subsp. jejuni]AOV09368.1 hypothetical protein MTVDSCj13_b0021 [Campylobacter jejuni]
MPIFRLYYCIMPIGSTFYIFFKKAKEPKNKDFSIISPKY